MLKNASQKSRVRLARGFPQTLYIYTQIYISPIENPFLATHHDMKKLGAIGEASRELESLGSHRTSSIMQSHQEGTVGLTSKVSGASDLNPDPVNRGPRTTVSPPQVPRRKRKGRYIAGSPRGSKLTTSSGRSKRCKTGTPTTKFSGTSP